MGDPLTLLQSVLGDRYAIERELGRGGMATVYLARDLKHDRQVAIKVLRPELAAALGPERFLREIHLAAQLNHPHILPLLDSGEAAGFLYYIMPFVEGESLRDRLTREKQLPLTDGLRIAADVAAALSYAHSHGVVHRDIKPENILLEGDQAVVADFGIAKAISAAGGDRLTGTGLAIGTPAYMSPEQAGGEQDLDGRADIYALGCVLYEMLAGVPPFLGPSAQAILARHSVDAVPSLHTVRSTVPAGVVRAIEKALAKVPADRFATARAFAEALESGRATVAPERAAPGARRRTRWYLIAAADVLVAGAIAIAFSRRHSPPGLDPNLIVVAPFDVLGADQLWHEGLVDVLARTLDGLAPFRTVPQTLSLRHWNGRADSLSARRLGQLTGAGLVVYGQLVGIGKDSVRLSATVLELATGHIRPDFERAAPVDRIAELADSFSIAVLRALGRKSAGVPRLSSVGTRSLPALKAFLRGEQYLRRTMFDSALVEYDHAVALDTSFALAMRRLQLARDWGGQGEVVTNSSRVRAGQLNHGLAPRDSLLLVADSLGGAAEYEPLPTAKMPLLRRQLATLLEAALRYPEDPEIWYGLAELRYHAGTDLGGTPLEALETFDRAIALDSTFGPAYIHPLEDLLLIDGDTARALRYIRGYERLPQYTLSRPALPVLARMLDPAFSRSAEARQIFDTMSIGSIYFVLRSLRHSPDSAETAVELTRRLFGRVSRQGYVKDSLEARNMFAFSLASRGHLREAYQVVGHRTAIVMPGIVLNVALFNGVPRDTATALFNQWLTGPDLGLSAVPLLWWAAQGDTASIGVLTRRATEIAATAADPWERDLGRNIVGQCQVALALARHDTTAALRRLEATPNELSSITPLLLAAVGRDRDAAALLQWNGGFPIPMETLKELVRGRVAERLGDRETAVKAYQFVLMQWLHADAVLQPYVAEARAALARLSGEPRNE
ncbi:MAG: serine/threonine-protein kinase [Gemmatimonadota bacterium]